MPLHRIFSANKISESDIHSTKAGNLHIHTDTHKHMYAHTKPNFGKLTSLALKPTFNPIPIAPNAII